MLTIIMVVLAGILAILAFLVMLQDDEGACVVSQCLY